jgi:hypothetical protein
MGFVPTGHRPIKSRHFYQAEDKKICSPEKSHISRGKYDYFEGEQIFISPLCKGNECVIPPGQRFGEFCQIKSFGHLCLQNYYFGTSLELSLLTWNTVI